MDYNSKEFRNKLEEAINEGKDVDWAWDGEVETMIDTFNVDDAVDAVIKMLNNYDSSGDTIKD